MKLFNSKYFQNKEEFWLIVIIAIYFAVNLLLSLFRHYTFHSCILDLGNFEQILWNTSHGDWFALSTRPWTNSYLGDHFSLILILPTLVYKILPFTSTILIMQTLLISISGYLVFLLAKTWSFSKKQGILFVLIFFTFPALGFINNFDAHANVYAIPLGLLFLIAFKRQKYNQLLIYLFLLLLVKEDLSLILAAFGLAISFDKRHRYLGLMIFFISSAWFYLVMTILIPIFSFAGSYHYVEQLESGNVIKNILSIFSIKKISYIFALFGSTLFIPLFSGRYALPVIIGLTPVLLSRWTTLSTIAYHYPASYLAFVIFSLMAFFSYLNSRKSPKISPVIILYIILSIQILIIMIAISTNFFGPKYCKTYFCLSKYKEYHSLEIKKALKMIPAQASVSSSNNLGSHLAKRKKLYIYPRIEDAKYILIDLSSFGRWTSFDIDNQRYLSLESSLKYQKIYSRNGIILFKNSN